MQKKVIGFDTSAGIPILADHVFSTSDDGQLQHFIDGRLRSTVPPEGWGSYVESWPEAQEVVDSLRRPATVAQDVTVSPADNIAILEAALAAARAAQAQPEGAENAVAS